jgi:hypothetical protein
MSKNALLVKIENMYLFDLKNQPTLETKRDFAPSAHRELRQHPVNELSPKILQRIGKQMNLTPWCV